MDKDIILFYYYSSPPIPQNCYLQIQNDIVYRNMFLFPCGDNKIHFEFPMFEDHGYNTICNRKGLVGLIKPPSTRQKYIVFRTQDQESQNCIIVGYYRVVRAYYQETRMFNNNGFVWGIEAEPHLIEKGLIECNGLGLRRGPRMSWHKQVWFDRLHDYVDRIESLPNLSDMYRSETNRLVELFKDPSAINQWRQYCEDCGEQSHCLLMRRFKRYGNNHTSDMFSVLNHVYNSNLYSRNVLTEVPKVYLR